MLPPSVWGVVWIDSRSNSIRTRIETGLRPPIAFFVEQVPYNSRSNSIRTRIETKGSQTRQPLHLSLLS